MDYSLRFYSHTDSSKSKLSTAFSDVSDDAKLTAWHQVPRMPTYSDVYNLSPQDPDIIRDRTQGGWPRPVIPITPAQKKGKIKKGHLDTLKNEYSAQTLSGMKTGGGSILEFIRKQKEGFKALDREQQMRDSHRNKEMEWEEAISRSNEMLKTAKIDGLRMSRELMNDLGASEGGMVEVPSEYLRKKPLAITWDGVVGSLGDTRSTNGKGGMSPASTGYNAGGTFTSAKGSTTGGELELEFDFKVPATEHLHMKSTHFPRAHEDRFTKMHTNILFKTPDDDTRLFEAAIYDDFHVVRGLLELLPDAVTITDNNGNSALSIAALYGSVVTSELLIYAGAKINHKNNFGLGPFDLACVRKNKAVAALLLFSGATANFEHCTPKFRVSVIAERQKLEMAKKKEALFEALDSGDVEAVTKLIVEEGVDVNSSDPRASPDDPYSPLHVALLASPEPNVALVKMLLEKGADIGIMDINGDTPLHVACGRGTSEDSSVALIECIAALLEKEQMSMDQMPPNTHGRTALFHACMAGNATIAGMLFDKLPILANRHELERRDTFGHACLYYANAAKASDLCAFLVEQGLTVSLPVTAV